RPWSSSTTSRTPTSSSRARSSRWADPHVRRRPATADPLGRSRGVVVPYPGVMGLFDRIKATARRRPEDAEDTGDRTRVRALPDTGDTPPGDLPLKPESRRLTAEERQWIDEVLATLE